MARQIQSNFGPIESSKISISVVIPVYNEEKIISKVLAGILLQSHMPNEVIVVDNGSTDRTKQVALSFVPDFKKKKLKYRVLSETKIGSANARNKGFFAAKSFIIASVDADIYPYRDWIYGIRQHFLEYNSIAVSGISVVKDSNILVQIISELNWYKYLTLLLHLIFGFQTITTANAAIRKDVFETVEGFDTKCISPDHLDDTELSSRLSDYGTIRIDTRIRVEGSFRRYQPLSRAITSSFSRLQSWVKICKGIKE